MREEPLYYKRTRDSEWEKFEDEELGRTAMFLVLPDGNLFSVEYGRFIEQFDPLRMRDIAASFGE